MRSIPKPAETHLVSIASGLASKIQETPHAVSLSALHSDISRELTGQPNWSHGEADIHFSQPRDVEQPDPRFIWMDRIVGRLDAFLTEHDFSFHHAQPFGRAPLRPDRKRTAPGDVDFWYLNSQTRTAIVLRLRRKTPADAHLPVLGIRFLHAPDNLESFAAQRRHRLFPENVHPVPEAAKQLVRALFGL